MTRQRDAEGGAAFTIRIAAGETARLKTIVMQSDSPALKARLEPWGDKP